MKKLLFILAATSIMIGAGSCHRDEPTQNSQTAEVKSASPNLQIDDNTQAVVTLDDGTQIINLINGTQIVTRNDDSSQFEVYNYDNAQVIMRAYADPDEKVEFTITLLSGGDHKTCVIKKVREITGFGLKEAKKLVDGAPSVIIQNISKELTDIYWNMLINCGGKIIVMIS